MKLRFRRKLRCNIYKWSNLSTYKVYYASPKKKCSASKLRLCLIQSYHRSSGTGSGLKARAQGVKHLHYREIQWARRQLELKSLKGAQIKANITTRLNTWRRIEPGNNFTASLEAQKSWDRSSSSWSASLVHFLKTVNSFRNKLIAHRSVAKNMWSFE